ncbi:MAG: hypothetical protein IT258_21465, partial [Saprospiraceae bacterium]|nr:hypothetical protein [Saprospiraceae bacterium]
AKQFFVFPSVWEWLGYAGNWISFFVLGFIAVLMVTNEFSNRTLRQNIIGGLHREEFFKSKLVFILVTAAAATVYYAISALVIGAAHLEETPYLSTVFKHIDYIPRYFLMATGYMSFGLLVGLLTRKTGIALFVFIAYAMILEPLIRWLPHMYFIKNLSMALYPINSMEDLVPNVALEFFFDPIKNFAFRMVLTPLEAAIATVSYTSLFFFFSYKRLKNSDL